MKMNAIPEGRAILHALTFAHKTEGERKREMEKRLRKEIRGLREQVLLNPPTEPREKMWQSGLNRRVR